MSTDDRTQTLQEIDFFSSRLPYLWAKYKSAPKGVRQSYRGCIEAALIVLDAAVGRLLAQEGLQRLSKQDPADG